jgi:exosortase
MRLARAPAAAWLGLAALAAFAWREGLAFALSSGPASDVESMFFDAADNPPWLISLVGAGLLFSRWRELRARIGPPASLLGASALLALGLALLAWARFVSAPDLALLGMVLMALGAAAFCFGARFARAIALPVGLLAFAIPAPGALVNYLVYPLQLVTSDYAFALLRPLGVAAIQNSDVIRTASHTFIVIEGCSGLGSMEVLTLLALAWAWYSGASFGRGLALGLAAPVIAFALNGPRVVGLVLFPDNAFWSGHTTQGVVVFAVGALCIALLDGLLERRSGPAAPEPAGNGAPWPVRPPQGAAPWLLAAALASALVPRYAPPATTVSGTLLPESAPPWHSERETEPDVLFLGSVRFTHSAQRTYVADPAPLGTVASAGQKARVEVLVGEDARRIRSTSLLSKKHRVLGRGWSVEEARAETLAGGMRGEGVVSRSEARRVLSWVWYVGVESVWVETLRGFLALDQSPFHRPEHAYVIRLTTDLGAGDADADRAARRLRLLAGRLGGQLPAQASVR